MLDVAVIGGGPTGCFLACRLASAGWEVAIFEEHPRIGYPWCCAGIVGIRGMEEIGIRPKRSLILEELRGAVLHFPTGERAELWAPEPQAWVLDRPRFDQQIADLAVNAGAQLNLRSRCRKVRRGEIEVNGSCRRARVIVGADGPNSLVGRRSGLVKGRRFMNFAQVEVRAEVTEGVAEVFLGSPPGFFSWLVPAGDRARVGLGSYDNPFSHLERFLSKLHRMGRIRGSCGKPCADIIPLDSPHLVRNGILLVGDAAAQVKPITKGGLYIGLSCSQLAASSINDFLERGSPLDSYQEEVRRRFGSEFRWGRVISSTLFSLGPRRLKVLYYLLRSDSLRRAIVLGADFDHHVRSVKCLPHALLRILFK